MAARQSTITTVASIARVTSLLLAGDLSEDFGLALVTTLGLSLGESSEESFGESSGGANAILSWLAGGFMSITGGFLSESILVSIVACCIM